MKPKSDDQGTAAGTAGTPPRPSPSRAWPQGAPGAGPAPPHGGSGGAVSGLLRLVPSGLVPRRAAAGPGGRRAAARGGPRGAAPAGRAKLNSPRGEACARKFRGR
jgi:hypothetical protein